jgi:hypothetical protein
MSMKRKLTMSSVPYSCVRINGLRRICPKIFDGDQPYGIEVFDKLGNLYTTTAHGSTNQLGAVIKLRP